MCETNNEVVQTNHGGWKEANEERTKEARSKSSDYVVVSFAFFVSPVVVVVVDV